MQVGVIGINHKLANLDLRELLAKACQRRFMLGCSSDAGNTFILLTTCNRTEIYFSSEDLAYTHSVLLQTLRDELDIAFDQKVYSFFGYDCFLHLSRVTAGLDSAILGETEIQGQVKLAYETAAKHFHLSREIHYLFQNVLKIGKKVRSALNIGRGFPDLEHAIFHAGQQFFSSSSDKKILFVGASNVNDKIITYFKSKNLNNITITNRSFKRADLFSKKHHVQLLEWEQKGKWLEFDWMIFGTKSPFYLLKEEDKLEPKGRKLIFDLSVPRNVDPLLRASPSFMLYNIDEINGILQERKQRVIQTIDRAEELILEAAKRNISRFYAKNQLPEYALC